MPKAAEVRIEYVALSELERWPRNPKAHSLDVLADSLARFGFVAPLVMDERTGRLVAGHGRVDALAAMKADGGKPPARVVEKGGDWAVPVVRGISFRSEAEAEAYLLADNQTAVLGGWDGPLLQEVLKDHSAELLGTGFSEEDLRVLASAGAGAPAAEAAAPEPVAWTVSTRATSAKDRDAAERALQKAGFEATVRESYG